MKKTELIEKIGKISNQILDNENNFDDADTLLDSRDEDSFLPKIGKMNMKVLKKLKM